MIYQRNTKKKNLNLTWSGIWIFDEIENNYLFKSIFTKQMKIFYI